MRADPRAGGELAGAELGARHAVDAAIPRTEIAMGEHAVGKLAASSSRLEPSAAGGNGAPARIACQRARKIGVRRSSSAHSASSLLAAGSSPAATVAAMRNLAGRGSPRRRDTTTARRGSPDHSRLSARPSRSWRVRPRGRRTVFMPRRRRRPPWRYIRYRFAMIGE